MQQILEQLQQIGLVPFIVKDKLMDGHIRNPLFRHLEPSLYRNFYGKAVKYSRFILAGYTSSRHKIDSICFTACSSCCMAAHPASAKTARSSTLRNFSNPAWSKVKPRLHKKPP